MKIGSITISAIFIGALWGAIWMVVIGLLLMLVSGLVVSPNAGLAALVGGFAALGYLLFKPEDRASLRVLGIMFVGITAALLLVTGISPFDADMNDSFGYQFAALLLLGGVTTASIHLCLDGYSSGSSNRYRLELLLIRVLKGLAFVLFTIVVVLPFYVMLMTSLKSQQSLLSNPLDFSINISQGASSLFRSYIELFTQYHFGSFLANSAMVSVATVIITLFFAIPGAYAVALPQTSVFVQVNFVDLHGASHCFGHPTLCCLFPSWLAKFTNGPTDCLPRNNHSSGTLYAARLFQRASRRA